ncbi:MAG: hypothetical protein KAG66_03735 [Methylococcales bacterium]|nr:hypothetical protein [Methylococcales bacterium]
MKTKHLITLDWETWYSAEYTLKKLSATEYIRDPRFHSHGLSAKVDDQETKWYSHEALLEAKLPWHDSTVLSHNALFDMLILTERLNIRPKAYADTLAMAKALLIQMPNYKLDTLAKVLLNKEKLKDDSGLSLVTIGKNRDLAPGNDMNRLAKYCINDTDLCYELFQLMAPELPEIEWEVMSTTIKWFAEPALILDTELLKDIQREQQEQLKEKIALSTWPQDHLSSNKLFVERLEQDHNIAYPTKISPRTGKPTHATSKNDPEYIELQEMNPHLNDVWVAREAVKSTLQASRIKTFLNIAALAPDPKTPTLPVPLKYCEAGTHRWAGTGKINMQNLPNLRSSRLRKAITAPDGYNIVVADSAQIELRINMWFCGQTDFQQILDQGGDVYKTTASKFYSKSEEAVTKNERGFGKICELALGYNMGPIKFRHTCASGPMGMPPIAVNEQEAQKAVNSYRAAHPAVTGMWKTLDQVIYAMSTPERANEAVAYPDTKLDVLRVGYQHLLLPDGLRLWYGYLTQDERTQNWYYGHSPKRDTLYGGKLLENICQALARSIIAEQIVMCERAGIQTVSSTHDEIIAIAPEGMSEQTLEQMIKIMSTSPTWCQDLVLSAEGGYDKEYSK